VIAKVDDNVIATVWSQSHMKHPVAPAPPYSKNKLSSFIFTNLFEKFINWNQKSSSNWS